MMLFNLSLSSGWFPSVWKDTFVTVVHKSGLRSKVENYRQVSILSYLGKMFDLLMCGQGTFASSSIITERQHGILKGRSTPTNLIEFVSSVINSLEAGKLVDALDLDFS